MSAVELPNCRTVEGVDKAPKDKAHSLSPCGVDVLSHKRRLGPRSDTPGNQTSYCDLGLGNGDRSLSSPELERGLVPRAALRDE